jgi:hypothetical protein
MRMNQMLFATIVLTMVAIGGWLISVVAQRREYVIRLAVFTVVLAATLLLLDVVGLIDVDARILPVLFVLTLVSGGAALVRRLRMNRGTPA